MENGSLLHADVDWKGKKKKKKQLQAGNPASSPTLPCWGKMCFPQHSATKNPDHCPHVFHQQLEIPAINARSFFFLPYCCSHGHAVQKPS